MTGSFLLSFHADTLKIQQETRPGSIKADDKTVIRISHTLQGIFFFKRFSGNFMTLDNMGNTI